MASKYLSAGSMSWTPSTRVIDGGTITPVLDASDAGRAVVFMIGTAIYSSRIDSIVDGNTAVLMAGSGLPSLAGTVIQFMVLDQGERHDYVDYMTEIDSMLQQGKEKLLSPDRQAALAQAVSLHGENEPYMVRKQVSGNGTMFYLLSTILGALWVPGHTRILGLEYPHDNVPPRILVVDDEWIIYDDGTAQDGSNLQLRFLLEAPMATEKFIVMLAPEMIIPQVGVQNFPDTQRNFKNITLLASSLCCERLAASFAQTSDTTISADVVNYRDIQSKYMSLAKQYRREYNLSVFGQEDPPTGVQAAIIEKRIITTTEQGTAYLFHTRRRR